jgi:16S rRNA (guanine(966)-N(2))-methyltransferase RsmD
MKIIAGEWGGQPLPGRPHALLRPTSDKVREAIFNQLEARYVSQWSETPVLDLFAGTGGLGFEALSRGAARAVFVDHHPQTVKQIKKTAEVFQATDRVEVLCKGVMDSIRWLGKRGDRYPLIFLDPPYRQDWIVGTMNALYDSPLLAKNGLVVTERDKREPVSALQGFWTLENERRYGDTVVSLFSRT